MERLPQGGWRVRSPWRQLPVWTRANMLASPPALPRPNLIFCRNILIYFSEANKTALLSHLANQLAPGGVLLLGSSEYALGHPLLEQAQIQGLAAYQRKG